MQKFSVTAEWELVRSVFLSSHPVIQLMLRALTAVFGGYGVSYSLIRAVSLWLPLSHTEATFFCGLLLPLVYLTVFVWAFTAESVQCVWKGLLGVGLISGAMIVLASCLR